MTEIMRNFALLVPTLLLAWAWTIQALDSTEPLYPTQENFDLTRFLGTWHDVAVAKTCKNMDHHKKESAIGKLVLQRGEMMDKLDMTRTVLKNGTCKEKTGDYTLTATPGNFRFAKWGAEVDAYVVHTNYEEYALMIMVKNVFPQQSSISVKLYSRTMDVRDTVLDDFKRLAIEQGISNDNIIIKQNKGDCVPGEVVEVLPSFLERAKRNAAPVMPMDDLELDGSGDDALMFNGSEACTLGAEPGPCFGIFQRFFYNSSAMACQTFHYGGCMGNKNNFKTERECLQRCRTEAVCRLPLTAVACAGEPTNWSFDSTLGECVSYKENFCQTNGNKFYSKAECDEYCGLKAVGILEEV
ncbi:protein AMBP-like [Stigmatopora argus]